MNEKGYITVKVDQSRTDTSKWMDAIISGTAFGNNKKYNDKRNTEVSGGDK